MLADALYRRIDWWWMLTNDGAQPDKSILAHGWRPESGFITYNYGAYSEAILLYLLGLGAPVDPVEELGWDGDALEAQCFGFLAARTRAGLPISFPRTTGVARPLTGGTISAPGNRSLRQ